MAKKLTVLFFFLTFLIASSISAFDNYIIFEKIIDHSDNYGFIEPILDAQKELNGFIYSDTTNNQLIIEWFQPDSLLTIELSGKPLKTVHYFSDNFDTLFCFTLFNNNEINSTITKFTISDLVDSEELPVSCYSVGAMNHVVNFLDLKLDRDILTGNHKLLFQKATRFDQYYETMGPVRETIPTSAIIDPATMTILTKNKSQATVAFPLFSQTETDYITYSNIYYFYDFRDYPEDPNVGSSNTTYLDIYDKNYSTLFDFESEPAYTHNIFTGNFKPSTDDYELIYFGNALDLAGYNNDPVKYLGCYSFASGFPEEQWYNSEIGNIDFEYVYEAKDYLIGLRGKNEIIFFDYLNGNIEDSTNLYRDAGSVIFFEGIESLNMFGRSGDTIFVNRFDVTLGIDYYTHVQEEIPLTFTLFQNHPNPFNGETRLEFEVEEMGHFTLKIYNVLGQEIKHLVGGVFAPGVYQYYWNGKNESGQEQSSGIYFARLQADENSQMIKLIYIK